MSAHSDRKQHKKLPRHFDALALYVTYNSPKKTVWFGIKSIARERINRLETPTVLGSNIKKLWAMTERI